MSQPGVREQWGGAVPQGAPSLSPGAAADPRVTRAVEEYLDALKAGRRPDRRQFLARHPAIAEALAECLDGLEFIRAAATDLPLPAGDQAGLLGGPGSEPQPAAPLGDFRIMREVGRGG